MQLAIFKYQEENTNSINDFTTIEIEGEPWFIAVEVCNLLGLTNVTEAIRGLDDDEKLTSPILRAGQVRATNLINESGLYNLIFRSKKPSAKAFRKWVTKEVIPVIRKTGAFVTNRVDTPNFVVRFNDNWDRTDRGHFSVISELFIRIYGRFEQVGYQIPNKAFDGKEIRPDVSVGRLFSQYLKDNYPSITDTHKMYSHKFPNGMTVDARQYKNEILPVFIKFIDEVWMPQCAAKYLGDRDKLSLEFLPKLLGT
ncbi:BRO-N domain-containing protein [Mucilaginibacter flavus]|uniref:BRO-N domain-containing protein n=1 Tax=Mucilaginibacter flavus TaxID=931504 RepID=UPI0025B2DE89|nr:Bro-N domain-containing protein [Mucilaginibacter flavus]MDN3581949.1 Bro-N domain-containing protein [Mucilaginibacter flavus]